MVPTYRPTAEVTALATCLADRVKLVLISDDGSPCTSDALLMTLTDIAGVTVARHASNAGIARGLNEGLSVAREAGAPWLLTIDQDSAIDEHYVELLVAAATDRIAHGERLGALGAEWIEDSSGVMRYPIREEGGFPRTEEVIQTGTLWNVGALVSVGGFDASLGMDGVDAGACLALRRAGFVIGVAPGLRVQHRLGDGRTIRIGGRSVMVTGHSPERRASMVRSRLRLFPGEFAESPRHALRTLRRVAVNQTLGIVVERQRWAKVKGTMRGMRPSRTR